MVAGPGGADPAAGDGVLRRVQRGVRGDDRRGTSRRDVLPVTPHDVLAHTVRVMVEFARMWDQGLAFPSAAGVLAGAGAGSSAWAVSPDRSATGAATLTVNPHLAWIGFNRFFEVRSVSAARRFHGVTLLGLPWQQMGSVRPSGGRTRSARSR